MDRPLVAAIRRPRMVAALALLIAGTLLTVAVAMSATPILGEAALAREVQRLPGWLEPLFRGIRSATETEVTSSLAVLLAIAVALAGQRRRALWLVAALALLLGTQSVAKDLLDRPRPSEAYVDVRDGWTSPSYPAGHAMGGTFLFVTFALLPPRSAGKRARAFATGSAVVLAGANAVANVYMGVHWPTDVAGGVLFGSGFALAASAAAGARAHPPNRLALDGFKEGP